MPSVGKRLLVRSAVPAACVAAVLWAGPAQASDLDLFSAETLELNGDFRVVATDGEKSWVNGGFGKLRSGSDGDVRAKPELGNANLIWKPQLTWSLGATIVGSLQGGARTEAGLSQAYLTFKPMRGSKLAASARLGLMWPPVSLEHEGADWHVRDSITPSAINSWIGEEVRPLAAEATIGADVGGSRLRLTAAMMAANDTAGTLLTFRGWALHDRTTLAFRRQPLPPLGVDWSGVQAPYTHPLIDLHGGFAHRPGYYVKLGWQLPAPIRIEFFRYDNRADPEDVNSDFEWGWRTQFDNAGLVADLGAGAQLKAQALRGRTRMGFAEAGRRWIDNRFRSAFVLLNRPFGPFGVAVRAEAFATHNRGAWWGDEYDEQGWSAMASGMRNFGAFTGVIELLHVSSRSDFHEEHDLAPRQRQTQAQAQLRMRW